MKILRPRRLLPWTVLAVLAASCRTVSPAPGAAPLAPAPPRRVVLLSLDGAGTETLHQLYEEGQLTAGGFARFFQEGQVAERLVPVNPTLTATNHISLATGYPAGQTGIVGNNFHPAGAPFSDTVSGFAAPIGTETLWEAARRQGRRVGVTTWPGADDTGPRRRADWGMIYVNNADRRADLVTVDSGLWDAAEATAKARGIESRSPVVGLLVRVGSGGPGVQTFDLLAVDRTDDGKVNYDGLVILPPGNVSGPAPGPLNPGQWVDLPCQVTSGGAGGAGGAEGGAPPRNAVCPVKLLNLAPDLDDTRLYFGGVYPLKAYPDDFAAALAGQGLAWPGPPDDRQLSNTWQGRPGIDLDTWVEQSDRFTRFFGDSLIAAARRPDWDLLMGYVPVIDEAGHELQITDPRQPGFSPERRDAAAAARRRVWQAVDRELARLLGALDLRTTVVAVVSDHGMTPAHTLVDANGLLREKGLLAVDLKGGDVLVTGTSAFAVGSGGVVHVYLVPGHEDLLPGLRDLFTGWTVGGERPIERVLSRQEAAGIGLDSPNSGDLILFLHEGYAAGNNLKAGKVSGPANVLGVHGYLNTHPDMYGIYMALGAGIAPGSAGTVQNTDVAGRVAGWMKIEKPRPSP
jgi:predicted AlkP superfamily pyrophosphatase or phosphodiesterase